MKRIGSILLTLWILVSFCFFPSDAFATDKIDLTTFALPKPQALKYYLFESDSEKETEHDALAMIYVLDDSVAVLAADAWSQSNDFLERNSLQYFGICLQYDVSLDGEENWQYRPEWDHQYYAGSFDQGYSSVPLSDVAMNAFEFFWLYYYRGEGSETFLPYQPAIISKHHQNENGDEWNTYHFDVKNHSLHIRCRYYMEWQTVDPQTGTVSEMQHRVSPWSDSTVFDQNSVMPIPEKPVSYEAPVISDLQILPPEGIQDTYQLTYFLTTPQSVWTTNMYYLMTKDGSFDGLKTQLSINGGDWQDYETMDSFGDLGLNSGRRYASGQLAFTEESNIRLRVRYMGSLGASEWSNVLELKGTGSNSVTESVTSSSTNAVTTTTTMTTLINPTSEARSLSGVFGWVIAILTFILLVVIVLIAATQKTICPSCGTKCKKHEETCPKCGRKLKNPKTDTT